jgi:hypothetical protein
MQHFIRSASLYNNYAQTHLLFPVSRVKCTIKQFYIYTFNLILTFLINSVQSVHIKYHKEIICIDLFPLKLLCLLYLSSEFEETTNRSLPVSAQCRRSKYKSHQRSVRSTSLLPCSSHTCTLARAYK